MPSDDIQVSWTGNSGHVLLNQSLSFIKTVISSYSIVTNKSISASNVLDFGCGWGPLNQAVI